MERREATSSRRSKRPAWASSTGDLRDGRCRALPPNREIFVRVQTFRRVPPLLPCNFCHPGQRKYNTRENLTFEQTPPSLISLWLSTVSQRIKKRNQISKMGSCKTMTAVAALTSLWPYLRRHNTTRIASRGGNGFINLFPFTRPPLPTSISILC